MKILLLLRATADVYRSRLGEKEGSEGGSLFFSIFLLLLCMRSVSATLLAMITIWRVGMATTLMFTYGRKNGSFSV